MFTSCAKLPNNEAKRAYESDSISYESVSHDTIYIDTTYKEEVNITENNGYRTKEEANIIEKINIINLVDTTKLIDDDFGIIAYNVPESFVVNEYFTIKLRISKNKKVESVVIGNRNIPIIGSNSNDEVIIETIQVDTKMTANLYADKSVFEVELTSNQEQNIFKDGYTEWVWRIKPLKSGESYIKMSISMSGRDIVVYEKDIWIEGDWKFSFTNWFSKWWQSIIATVITPILIPFGIWLYNKKKRKKKNQE